MSKITENQKPKIFFLVKGCIDDEIKEYANIKLNLDNLSKEQASVLIDTIYELENSDDESQEYAKCKFQILATLESLR